MTVQTYRRIPFEVQAIRYIDDNLEEVQEFVGITPDHDGNTLGFQRTKSRLEEWDSEKVVAKVWNRLAGSWLEVKDGQWIIRGERGEFFPMRHEEFIQAFKSTLDTDQDSHVFEGGPASSFGRELASLLNRHSAEQGSDTPDFILAWFLENVLIDWDHAVRARELWYDRKVGFQQKPVEE